MSRDFERTLGRFIADPNPGKAALARTGIEWSKNWRQAFGELSLEPVAHITPAQPQVNKAKEVKPEAAETEAQKILKQAVGEYTKGPLSPKIVTRFWQAKFNADGEETGLQLQVPECDWSATDIARPMVDRLGNEVEGMMVYVPREMTLPLLDKLYNKDSLPWWFTAREDTSVIDSYDTLGGWVKMHAVIDAPNRNINQAQAEAFAQEQGYLGGRLRTYILASQASRDLTGKFFDQWDKDKSHTTSGLFGSLHNELAVDAYYFYFGSLSVSDCRAPEMAFRQYGWRFEEVKKA